MLAQVQPLSQSPGYAARHATVPAKPGTSSERNFLPALGLAGVRLTYCRNAEIYGADEPAEFIYKIVCGSVRTYKLLDDGRRQIGAFYLPGDIFGLESSGSHRFSAEAVSEVIVIAIKRSTLASLAQTDAAIARELWQMTARELDHVHDQMVLLGRSSAMERVATFLLEMSSRAENRLEFELPMSRQDIADYLGLTIETVSRTISAIERKGLIELAGSRKVRLKNRAALRNLHA